MRVCLIFLIVSLWEIKTAIQKFLNILVKGFTTEVHSYSEQEEITIQQLRSEWGN